MANGWENYIKSLFGEVAPCDNCHHFNDCKNNEFACYAFQTYINSGRFSFSARNNPDNKTYVKIFKEEEMQNA